MQTIRKKGISLLVILAMLVSIVGIANTDTTYAATKKIHLKKTTVNLVVGKTYQQKLIAKNGKVIKATKVKWKSKNKSIAKINKKGKGKPFGAANTAYFCLLAVLTTLETTKNGILTKKSA